MGLGSTQPLTEMNKRNLPRTKSGWHVRLTTKCGVLEISQPYGPPLPVTGIALPFLFSFYNICTDRTSAVHILMCFVRDLKVIFFMKS
jgi:hypothetical protein